MALIFISVLVPLRVLAYDESFYSSNDILFYNPDDTGSSSSPDGASGDASSTGGNGIIGTVPQTGSLREFVDTYGQMAFNVGKKYRIPYEAILAQGILESAYGNSTLTTEANNFFGIKFSSSCNGSYVEKMTKEWVEDTGKFIDIMAKWCKYSTPEAGWDGYGQFITSNSRYNSALQYPNDPIAYITAIWKAGYATDPNYVSKVGSIANAIIEYIAETNKWPSSSEMSG